MKSLFFLPFLLPFLIIAQNDTMVKFFRITYLAKGKVALTENISSLKDIAIKIDDEHYKLKKDDYGIADSIGIEVNKLNLIVGITFRYNYEPEYPNDTAYIGELHKFQKILGSPGKEFKEVSKTNSVSVTVTKWEDKHTILELVEVIRNGKKLKAYSTIFDKQLIETSEIKAEKDREDRPITIIREL